ncbi:unnamed protein product [Pseudo-nitzschia multistriata]|uniref:Nudix hydrolase domain-containing protein n=1 Tax=Pseudo-nitzschia multistriata TaxID=183589 RepID=A0A448YVR5_9STRA|nr:unnamed protein product [Pseudo-nitzschia multistriata]
MSRHVSKVISHIRRGVRIPRMKTAVSSSSVPSCLSLFNKTSCRNFSYSSSSSAQEADEYDFHETGDNITENNCFGQSKTTSIETKSAAVSWVDDNIKHQRIWRPDNKSAADPLYWSENVVQSSHDNPHNLVSLLDRIEKQELSGGRMRAKQNGVLHEDPAVDMRLLIENYTVNSLASALRDREEMLQTASQMASKNDFESLKDFLYNCHPDVVLEKRQRLRKLNLKKPLNLASLEIIRKGLMRMPRQVTMAHSKRAGVVIPIVHVDGVPSILFEKRSPSLRAHPDEVCLPGGMVCETADRTIVETCLREMKEEIGGFDFEYHRDKGGTHGVSVLGTLRCNWGEVHHLVGVAVTPVVCSFNQDLAEVDLMPNRDEVAEVFTIPLVNLMDKTQWVYKDDHAPIFVGGPYAIWGLTGYILERFWKDILLPFSSRPSDLD